MVAFLKLKSQRLDSAESDVLVFGEKDFFYRPQVVEEIVLSDEEAEIVDDDTFEDLREMAVEAIDETVDSGIVEPEMTFLDLVESPSKAGSATMEQTESDTLILETEVESADPNLEEEAEEQEEDSAIVTEAAPTEYSSFPRIKQREPSLLAGVTSLQMSLEKIPEIDLQAGAIKKFGKASFVPSTLAVCRIFRGKF